MKTHPRVSRIAIGLAIVMTVLTATLAFAATSHASKDNELSVVDGKDRTLTVQQWDTSLNGVSPLDRNRLTREWFQSGRAKYAVTGQGADGFVGTLELGYQVDFPWSLGVGIAFRYTTPNIRLDKTNINPTSRGFNPLGKVITPNLFPGVSVSANLGNGPGVQEIATFSVDVSGSSGGVAIADAHGTVTGADGGVMLRPFARLISKDGESVTTYGDPWNMQ